MVGCPRCGDGSAIAIERDAVHPWQRGADGDHTQWAARCGSCGAEWTIVDRA